MYEERFMKRAIEISAQALEEPGTQPFGAVVVKDGKVVGEGLNRMAEHFDPTSHSEVEAIREACANLATLDLSGCELYTSCEPCPMCVATMNIAGIERLHYAASAAQSASALADLTRGERHTVSSDHIRSEIATPVHERVMPARQALAQDAGVVLLNWAAQVKSKR
jgi:tRNA(Arg) A34 adenosine deaminase TadA